METQHLAEDAELCYRAIRSRDARFDGRFFTGVTTTGVYCRPICPARTPNREHVRFFSCAAAAELAGFRACKRCHPEASPGSPEWNARTDLVARALRLIAAGMVDDEGVAGLARRLSVSERHLHRELVAEVGAGPLALARTRRTQEARQLVDQTSLSLTEIAFASGFRSIRQFNETMRDTFRCPPSELRRRVIASPSGCGALTLRLPYRPPLAVDTILDYFRQRALPAVEEVTGNVYRRTALFPRSRGVIELEPMPGRPAVELRLHLDSMRDIALVSQRARQVFDLDAAPDAVSAVLGADPLLAPLITERPGLRMPGAMNGFELAVRAVLGQQVSVAGARTLAGRLAAALGEPLSEPVGTLTHYFPTPDVVAEATMDGLGLTQGRINALRALARAVVEEGLYLERDADWSATVEHLKSIPGIGPWTASYVAMRALGNPDAFPAADLGLRRAVERLGLPGDPSSLERRAEAWRPWRAYAAQHLWASVTGSSPSYAKRATSTSAGKRIVSGSPDQKSRFNDSPAAKSRCCSVTSRVS